MIVIVTRFTNDGIFRQVLIGANYFWANEREFECLSNGITPEELELEAL